MAAQGPLDPTLNLSHVQWRAAEWLLAFGPLTAETVMDYFVLSPFFDRHSNNATLRMQMQFSRGGMQGVDEEAELRKFVGTEYTVVHAAPPSLFVIHKRERTSPTEATPVAAYYVLNDNIYQGPSLYSVVNERMLTSLHALSTSLQLLRSHKPQWTPESQYAWQIRPPPVSEKQSLDADDIALDKGASKPLTSGHALSSEGTEMTGLTTDGGVATNGDAKDVLVSAGQPDVGSGDDDELQRPSNAFNPLLFRALQTVAATLSQPPPPVSLPPVPPDVKSHSQAGTPGPGGDTKTEPVNGDQAIDGGSGGDQSAKGIRIGPTGKRKPQKAM